MALQAEAVSTVLNVASAKPPSSISLLILALGLFLLDVGLTGGTILRLHPTAKLNPPGSGGTGGAE